MDLNETIRRLVMAGVGAVSYSLEKSKDLADTLVKKGEETAAENNVSYEQVRDQLVEQLKNLSEKVRADMSKTPSAREAFEEIRAGMYDQMSFAFVVDDDEYDAETHTRTIKHLKKLYDTSFVSFPANPETDIAVATRSRFDGFIEAEQAERLEKEQRLNLAKAKYNYLKQKQEEKKQ